MNIMNQARGFQLPSAEDIANLGPAERASMAALLLEGLEPGRQPLELFTQFSRLIVAATVEVVPVRTVSKQPEVWLGRRSKDDPWYPDKWVLPGVVILPDDKQDEENTLLGPIKRLFKADLQGIQQVSDLHQIPSQFRFDGRGHEVTTQYWTHVQTGSEPYEGRFFGQDDLQDPQFKDDILTEGLLTIDRAIADYEAQRTA